MVGFNDGVAEGDRFGATDNANDGDGEGEAIGAIACV